MHHINNNLNNTQEQENFPISIIHNEKALAWRPIMPAPEILTQLRLNEIIQKVGSDKKDIPQNSNGKWQFSSLYRYTGEHNIRLYYRLRFHLIDANNNPIRDETGKIIKTFRPLTYGSFGDGKPNWYMKNPPYLPLYNLNQIFEYPEKTIVFVEGEQTADAGYKLCGNKYIFTTTGGATSAKNADFKPVLNRDILIIPDNDVAGRGYAETLAQLLIEASARSVNIVEIPTDRLPTGWDIADEFPEDMTINNLLDSSIAKVTPKTGKSVEHIDLLGVLGVINQGARHSMLVSACAHLHHLGFHPQSIIKTMCIENTLRFNPPLDEEEIKNTVMDFCSRYKSERNIWQEKQTGWSVIIPLPDLTPEITEMTPDYVPEPLLPFVMDICERKQLNIEMVVTTLLGALGGLSGCRLGIAPAEFDDWIEVLNIWTLFVLPSGSMKSDILNDSTKFLTQIDAKHEKEYQSNLKEYKKNQKIAKHEGKVFLNEEPVCRKIVTHDTTTQKLSLMMCNNENGMVSIQDELPALIASFLKKGREEDKAFYLKADRGYLQHTVDRIGRESNYIKHLCVTLMGCIQPDIFKKIFQQILADNVSGDGFVPRFQMIIYPKIKAWKLTKTHPNQKAEEQVREIFQELSNADFTTGVYHQHQLETIKDIPITRFTSDAQSIFDHWLEKNMNQSRLDEDEGSLMRSYLSKNRKLVPALALLFQLIDFFNPENEEKSLRINKKNLLLALKHRDFYEKNARKLFADNPTAILIAAHKVIQKIKEGKIHNDMTVRDLYKKGWSKLKNDLDVKPVFNLLQEHNYIRIEELPSGGRPSQVIRINPNIFTQITNKIATNNDSVLDIPKTHQNTTKSTISNDLEGLGFE